MTKRKRYRYSLWQDGIEVAAVDAPTQADANREILHYASVYVQDGPVEIRGDGVSTLFEKVKEILR